MKISLLSRFEGAILGGWLGIECHPVGQKEYPQQIIQICEQLSQQGHLKSQHWRELISSGTSLTHLPLLTLPLVLYFHDHKEQLATQMAELKLAIQLPQAIWDEIGLWQSVLVLILRQGIVQSTEEIVWELFKDHPQHKSTGELVRSCIDEGRSLKQTQARLWQELPSPRREFALAYYCVLGTLENPELSRKRAMIGQRNTLLVSGLTGAIVGVYNGGNEILGTRTCENCRKTAIPTLRHQCQQLYASWAGCEPSVQSECSSYLAVARPRLPQEPA